MQIGKYPLCVAFCLFFFRPPSSFPHRSSFQEYRRGNLNKIANSAHKPIKSG